MLTLDKVYHAAFVLRDVVRKTDLIHSPKLNPGCKNVYLKTENLQLTGSFKVRGAGYKISQLSEEENAREGTMIFVGTGNCAKLYSQKSEHGLELSYSKNIPYFCIWKWESADAKYICLEPWSDVPGDGVTPENFDTKKMSRLQAGEKASYEYSIKFN